MWWMRTTITLLAINQDNRRRLRTEISSSIFSQWMPTPPEMSRQFFLCAGDADRRRGDHASGTEMIRPSDNVTWSASSVQFTSTASGSTVTTEMLIPLVYNLIPPFFNDLPYLVQLRGVHPARFGEGDWSQPELGIFLRGLDVNVRRFISLKAEKEEAIAILAKNFGHGS